MSSTKKKKSGPRFRPGPYVAVRQDIPDGHGVRFEIIAVVDGALDYAVARTSDDGSPVGRATAYLLAAAPDLYEAGEAFVRAWDEGNLHAAYQKMKAALVRADHLVAGADKGGAR